MIAWTREHVAAIAMADDNTIPHIRREDVHRLVPGVDLWDLWPVREHDGSMASLCGGQVWIALSAPAEGDIGLRHNIARLRAIGFVDGAWIDMGPLFEEGGALGSRQWAGCARLDQESGVLTVLYTAAGRLGEEALTFEQVIARGTGVVSCDEGRLVLERQGEHEIVLDADGTWYKQAKEVTGRAGFIDAFRDPFLFVDPADGVEYVLFTATLAGAESQYDGAIGVARTAGDAFELLPPLAHADGVNNELERPHVVHVDGGYYVFFSTQRRTFDPSCQGPTGLYGFYGESLFGPYRPLNGSGLVIANPPREPFQGYSWLVLNDLSVVSFVDMHNLAGTHPDDIGGVGLREYFGATAAPILQIEVSGDRTRLVGAHGPLELL
ncbi:MAG TPA: glycoside hydrolase family 68 protein [Acidimicrobiia bacterium]